MKISTQEVDRILHTLVVPRTNGGGSVDRSAPSASAGVGAAAAVEMSERALEIQRVKDLVAKTPEVREDQVHALRERIQNGTYEVSGDDIADLMVRRAFADKIR